MKTYNSFDIAEKSKTLKTILEAFENFAIGERNETY
mgnify:CR=1 FL=1